MRIIAATMSVVLTCAATAAFAQSGDATRGERLFNQQCKTCHTVEKGGRNGIGPNLFGVAGRKAASIAGFSYSAALTNAKITWTNDKLKAWVTNPQKMVPGTRMTFAGFSDPAKADDVVAYLDTLK